MSPAGGLSTNVQTPEGYCPVNHAPCWTAHGALKYREFHTQQSASSATKCFVQLAFRSLAKKYSELYQ